VLDSVRDELARGLSGLLGQTVREAGGSDGLLVGTRSSASVRALVRDDVLDRAGAEGHVLRAIEHGGRRRLVLASNTERGALFGAFALLRRLQTGQRIDSLDVVDRPVMPLRMMNHWDNYD